MKLGKVAKTVFSALCVTTTMTLAMVPAHAYPDRVVKILVGYPPGGTIDVPARLLAQELSRLSGQSFIVENRPGASATLAANAVAKAEPDGYTLLLSSSANSSAGAILKQLPFDPKTAFRHIGVFSTLPTLIVARADFPATTLQEVIELAKSKPGELTYGSPGPGTGAHIAGQVLNRYADVQIQHIPFKGAAQSLTNLSGGHIDLMIGGLSSLDSAIRSKQIKVLAVTNAEPSPALVDAPTIAQALPGVQIPREFQFTSWLGLSAPAGTPDAVIERLEALMQEALDGPKLSQELIGVGVNPGFVPGDALAKHIDAEIPAYARIVQEIGIGAN